MLHRFMTSTAGAVFALLVVMATSLGSLIAIIDKDAARNIAAAETITATLSRSWNFDVIKSSFTPEALDAIDQEAIVRAFDDLKALGVLRAVRDAVHRPRGLHYTPGQSLVRTVTVDFRASFSRGDADVTVTLLRSGSVTKVQHLHIKPRALPKSSTARHIV